MSRQKVGGLIPYGTVRESIISLFILQNQPHYAWSGRYSMLRDISNSGGGLKKPKQNDGTIRSRVTIHLSKEDPICADLHFETEFERSLVNLEWTYVDAFGLNKSTSPANLKHYYKVMKDNFIHIPDYWHLVVLAVSPFFQRRGVGSQLLRWGSDTATKENIPVTVEASINGKYLYLKKGFKEIHFTQIAEGVGTPAMVWEPPKKP